VLFSPVPNCLTYDPAFAYELAVIIQDGIRRMYRDGENIFYYITVMNEPYEMPPMPEGARDGILKGMYRFKGASEDGVSGPSRARKPLRAQLLGSGAILNEVIAAQKMLEPYGVAADVWSVTSYNELSRNAHDVERWNMLHPTETARVPYVAECLANAPGVIVAASDYMKVLPDALSRWINRPMIALGTDGFGRSEDRAGLRNFFEVDARYVTVATLSALARNGDLDPKVVAKAIKDLKIDPEKKNPRLS
jgi:pyruvate dehydrogenase E1 component